MGTQEKKPPASLRKFSDEDDVATLGEEFCRRLIEAMPTPEAKIIAIRELGRWSGKTIYFPAANRSKRRHTVASNMLKEGMSKADAALAIHERFGVTLRQAQRDVKAANDKIDCQLSPE